MAAGEEDGVTEAATAPPSEPVERLPVTWPQRPARRAPVATRGDLLGAISVLSLVALLGLPLAWLWSRLAPAQLSLVRSDGTLVALPTESQHQFDDLAVFGLLGAAAGLLTGFAVWLLRQRRGPITLVAVAVGSLVAAWLAMRTGISFADGRYAEAVQEASPGAVVDVAPRLDSTWVIVVQPLFAVLSYGVAAAANGLDDLGRRLS